MESGKPDHQRRRVERYHGPRTPHFGSKNNSIAGTITCMIWWQRVVIRKSFRVEARFSPVQLHLAATLDWGDKIWLSAPSHREVPTICRRVQKFCNRAVALTVCCFAHECSQTTVWPCLARPETWCQQMGIPHPLCRGYFTPPSTSGVPQKVRIRITLPGLSLGSTLWMLHRSAGEPRLPKSICQHDEKNCAKQYATHCKVPFRSIRQ